ncbi:L-histidine N(alpha)-methyltransferase [Streptomyces sp. CSDS2]|uniref:class I SAM-dependent methyltransferase n=1 Tax=Streptomyces sp. CSDS2 TaxID=3055051 RepID=UPI0025B01519|nr:L-histidine N(alpha)-methyltransferase [Streptomyces sp. CSDS2]MDN3263311.1 L-histidine N(alpha)-methyltransferase [Streptomyces sp. CSDS2]
MDYFKHTDVARNFKVSTKTVSNWLDAAKAGTNNLSLHHDGRYYHIRDTPENRLIMEKLAQKARRYQTANPYQVIRPRPEFYTIYSRRQRLDIITNLNNGEIPRQYNYMQDGAINWDNWLKRLANEESSNILKGTVELIRANMESIDRLLEGKKKVNVIDLGVGNAYPVKEMLGHLIERNVLHRYIAIDISRRMLEVAERNIKEWYGDDIKFEGYERDIAYEHFDDLLVDDMLGKDADETINLVLLLGATPLNFRSFSDVFRPVHASMGHGDLLMYTGKPDTEVARRYFDFNSSPGASKLPASHKYILDLLNIDESLYDAEMGFDQTLRMRYIRVRLKKAITLQFGFGDSEERSVNLEQGDTILLLRVWHLTALEIITEFERSGFTLLQSSLTRDRQYFLSISGVEAKGEIEST